jgi:quercetin dioxygenase-like cupin family protein
MKRLPVLLALAAGLVATAGAQQAAPVVIVPDRLTWSGPPAIPALKGAWMVGAEGGTGPYLLRVRLAAGGRIPPHTHPDERHTTVLSGTIHVGFGGTFDEGRVVAVPTGAVYVAPAGVPHYVWAKDGAAEYQEAGVGPTATDFVAR